MPAAHRGGSTRPVRLAYALLAIALTALFVALPASLVGAQEATETPTTETTGATPTESPTATPTTEPTESPSPTPTETTSPTPTETPTVEVTETPTNEVTEGSTPEGEGKQPSQGFIQVEQQKIDDIPQNAPHEGCLWTIEFRNFDESLGGADATATLTLVPPTSIQGQTFSVSETTQLGGNDNEGPEIDGTLKLDISEILQQYLDAGGEAHEFQGEPAFHVRLDAEVDGDIEKHHVFWNKKCLVGPQAVAGIAVSKSCPTAVDAGDPIPFTITVRNTGNEGLVNLTVVDSLIGTLGTFPSSLGVGDSVTRTVSFASLPSDAPDVSNVVTASATGIRSDEDVSDTAGCRTLLRVPPPAPRPAPPPPPILVELPVTGAPIGGMATAAAMLTVAGAGLDYAGRRRRGVVLNLVGGEPFDLARGLIAAGQAFGYVEPDQV